MTRLEVYAQVDKERDYQDHKWGKDHESNHRVSDFLITIQVNLNDALTALGKGNYDLAAMAQVRKIAALSVAAMERFQTPPRNF